MKNYLAEKNVLVTGAGGFIGSYICEELVKRGSLVTAVVHDSSSMRMLKNISSSIKIKKAELTNEKHTQSLFRNEDIVIHAAAVDGGVLFKKTNAARIFHENTRMIINIFDALKNSKVKKFVFISSAEVYSGFPHEKPIKEEHFSIFTPTKPEHWYGFSKIIGEHITRLIGDTLGIDVIIIRPANIYGGRDTASKGRLVPLLLNELRQKRKRILLEGDGSGIRSFLYVNDYVENLLQLIEQSQGGVYNFAGTEPIQIRDFVKLFEKATGAKIIFKRKNKKHDGKTNQFLLDISKVQHVIKEWCETPYEQVIAELTNQI